MATQYVFESLDDEETSLIQTVSIIYTYSIRYISDLKNKRFLWTKSR